MGVQILMGLLFLVVFLVLAVRLQQPAANARYAPQTDFLYPGLFLGGVLGALVLRLVLGYTFNGFESDIICFKAWGNYAVDLGFHEMYSGQFFLDYPPGYLYVLNVTELFCRLFSVDQYGPAGTLMYKMVPILSDLLCGVLVWWTARKRLGEKMALFLSAAYLFCPAVLLNSAVWGQADSFCALLLLLTILLLWNGHIPAAAVLYGAGILTKPQMLIFAPMLIFWVIRKRAWKHLVLGPVLVLATVLLLATPFVRQGDYWWLVDLYTGTMDSYFFYTINAYNLWALLGLNWAALPPQDIWLQFGVPLATALCGVLLLKSRRDEVLFAAPVALMFTVFMLCTKMHERYLFPVLLFLLLLYLFTQEKRFLLVFGGLSFVHFCNVAYVLYLNNAYVSPTAPEILFLSFVSLLLYGYTVYLLVRVFVLEKAFAPLSVSFRWLKALQSSPETEWMRGDRSVRLHRRDWVALLTVTLVYGCFAFLNLGDLQSANTSWTPQAGEQVIFRAEEAYNALVYLPGIAPDDAHVGQRVGTAMRIEASADGEVWTELATDTGGSVYCWCVLENLPAVGKYIRITALSDRLAINEFAAVRHTGINSGTVVPLVPVSGTGDSLVDEQDVVPLYSTYSNSTYFDEIYHARTAYEHLLGLEPYENTHPPLGKWIISLGISVFGMNPFGWRCMGALFGVLMLPVLYHLLKRLFGSAFLSTAGTVLFAFDFMHYVQTRIATIDTYAVFFILLMYDAMVVFLQTDLLGNTWKKALLPLLVSGVCMGLGVASKWTVLYAAAGLAVLFFGKLWYTYRTVLQKQPAMVQTCWIRMLSLCLWCCLFFLLIPFALYFLAFLPLVTLPHNRYDVWGRFWAYQMHMYNYHANLQATHSFESPWYQWPFNVRNVWYYGNYNVCGSGLVGTISVLGSPLFWALNVPGMVYTLYEAVSRRTRVAVVAAVGFLAAYLPWVLVPRCTFIYHYFTAIPFLLVSLLLLFRRLGSLPVLQKPVTFVLFGRTAAFSRMQLAVCAVLLVHLVLFALFYPVLTGVPVPKAYADALEWMPTWFFI